MARCETCGNEYEHSFEISMKGRVHTFDCFECAIQALAPACAHCGCSIIGHGVERNGTFYCCDHCARHAEASSSGENPKDYPDPMSQPPEPMAAGRSASSNPR